MKKIHLSYLFLLSCTQKQEPEEFPPLFPFVIPLYRLIYPWYYTDSNLNINNMHTFFIE